MARYRQACHGDLAAALRLYSWNMLVGASFWESLAHLEVALRNTLADRMQIAHRLRQRPGTWLDDPDRQLDTRARTEIAAVRRRPRPAAAGYDRTIAELPFGFWRFLLSARYQTTLWPGLAGGFPHSPNRGRRTVADPVQRLHEFRNRLAHHEPVWNRNLSTYHTDLYLVLGYIDPDLSRWVQQESRIANVLAACPVSLPTARSRLSGA